MQVRNTACTILAWKSKTHNTLRPQQEGQYTSVATRNTDDWLRAVVTEYLSAKPSCKVQEEAKYLKTQTRGDFYCSHTASAVLGCRDLVRVEISDFWKARMQPAWSLPSVLLLGLQQHSWCLRTLLSFTCDYYPLQHANGASVGVRQLCEQSLWCVLGCWKGRGGLVSEPS